MYSPLFIMPYRYATNLGIYNLMPRFHLLASLVKTKGADMRVNH